MDDLLARGISAIRHAARSPSETDMINRLLEGAIEEVEDRSGFVYLARSDKLDLVKIGYSASPRQRMRALSAETDGEMNILFALSGSRLLEVAAHVRWARQWVRGEWFCDTKELREWFAGHQQRAETTTENSVTVGVMMTPEERERIRRAADRVGVGLSTYLRMKALEAAAKGDKE